MLLTSTTLFHGIVLTKSKFIFDNFMQTAFKRVFHFVKTNPKLIFEITKLFTLKIVFFNMINVSTLFIKLLLIAVIVLFHKVH